MKIIHICLNGPFTDNWGYQDNIIPKYHKKAGHEVTIIAPDKKHINTGEIVDTECGEYRLDNGIKIIRIKCSKKFCSFYTKIFRPYDIYTLLCQNKPDFIMIHGLIGSISALQAVKYIKKNNKNCKMVVDSHQYSDNTYLRKSIKYTIYKYVLRILNKHMQRYYKKIYCITPACMDFSLSYFGLDVNKLKLLPLGYDPETVNFNNKDKIRKEIRNKYIIKHDDILLVSGGKLDENKKTYELALAVSKLPQNNVKLIIFGSFTEQYKPIMEDIIFKNKDRIQFVGFLNMKEYCNIFLAADIAVFPNSQSALWQQAISCGLAAIVRHASGTDYLDLGGNVAFLEDSKEKDITEKLNEILENDKYKEMQQIAQEKGPYYFSYERIAKVILDDIKD